MVEREIPRFIGGLYEALIERVASVKLETLHGSDCQELGYMGGPSFLKFHCRGQ
jgi:hypothetical protein